MEPPPPPPPPHGSNQHGGRSGGLPDGKYDIFVIPPHSSGSGFLYLPSLQTQRNSFLAGCFCTAASFFIYTTAVPVIKDWLLTTINGGGGGVLMLICGIAVVAWAFGKTQGEWAHSSTGESSRANTGSGDRKGPNSSHYATGAPPPQTHTPPPQSPPPPPPNPNPGPSNPPPQSSWQRAPPQANTKANTTGTKSSWEKAREETRKREEERKRAEELKRRREELEKERQKQREKDASERLERERKEKKEREEKAAAIAAAAIKAEMEKEKEKTRAEAQALADAAAKARAEAQAHAPASPKRPPMPSARTEREDDAYSFRPYDRPKQTHKANSAASMYSESSYAPSQSTARTTPPPSARGPYSTKDPDKIILKGVFAFNNAFMRTPVSQLISGQGNVTDGLILRITTEGFFIDDDVRGVAQREWDVKAWTMKLAEIVSQSCEINGMHVLRATIREQEGRKYVFILSQSEGWKVAVGLQRLRRGNIVQAMGVAGLPQNEAKAILQNLGFA
ncbi:uncharacterized protein A1O9_06670 [Exophiala aquamarina CBS 119918]|uniref:Uncharacterized protein n=1 Tax=Exophiala aquamarina CBS 119918 TaxID=1182545 RepID=A0A072PF61_9EURO|nr:uncharacterized protein A1O9_06670 [Exophiala aquamarina CBS 119918]KEF58744.1 hypothetical protein A1O9_06670 [Exophiala aquamarina CBS 119918]